MAVKRISVAVADAEAINREMEYHNRLDHHNVLKLLHVEEEKDPNFKYEYAYTVIIYISMELNIELLVADELKVPGA